MKLNRDSLAALLAILAVAAHAEEAKLDTVVVTAPKDLPAAAPVVGPDLLRQRATTSDTASLLRDVPGVSLYGAGGVSSLPAIHGLADDRVRTKVDGMDLVASCPNHMNSPLSYVDPTNVGIVKVYAGISPVSIGGDGIGGSIVVDTPAPVFAAPGQGHLVKGEAGAFYRSNGNASGANLSATYATESFNLSYSGATAESDNYKAGSNFKTRTDTGVTGHTLPLDEVGSSAYKTRNHTLGFALKGDRQLLEAKLGYQDIPYELYPNQRMDMLGNTQHRINLRYLGQFDWGSLEARAWHEKVDHHMDFGPDKRLWYGTASGGPATLAPVACTAANVGTPTCAAGMPMDTESKNTGAVVTASLDLTQQDLLRIGGELQHYQLNDWWPPSGANMQPDTFWNIRDGKRDRTALFGEWEKRASPQWMTLLGLRYERVRMDTGRVDAYAVASPAEQTAFNARGHEKTDNNWDLTALARYTADATRDIEFGFARKVRSPNLYERYSWRTGNMEASMNNFVGDGNGYYGNIDLKPETAHTLSATFDWHAADRGWELKATPYYTRVKDYVDAVRGTAFTANQFNVLTYANQSARIYGLDVSGRMPLATTGAGEFGLKGLLGYTNGKNLDTGDSLYNIMPLNAKLTLTQRYGGWDNGIELVAVKAKDKLSDVRNEIRTAGYGLVHVRASYSWKQARVDFGIENLFDKGYALPLGGAYVGQGTTMVLNPANMPWGIPVPGKGRSIYTAVNFRF
jgi:iron complex outermembrane receptor protein